MLPSREFSRSPVPVVLTGLFTTALALAGVFFLSVTTEDFNVMGWYANYIIPIGAILVGLVASSGYGIASWRSGVKITKGLLWTVLGLQVLAYGVAQYLEYRTLPSEVLAQYSFADYFDIVTRSFAWQNRHGDGTGSALGAWGYGLRALEVVGFGLGSLIVPGVLAAHPYCADCRVYMRTKTLATLPATVKKRKIRRGDTGAQAAYDAEIEETVNTTEARRVRMMEMVEKKDAFGFAQELQAAAPGRKDAEKLPARIIVELIHCPSCRAGKIRTALVQQEGNNYSQQGLSEQPVDADFTRGTGA